VTLPVFFALQQRGRKTHRRTVGRQLSAWASSGAGTDGDMPGREHLAACTGRRDSNGGGRRCAPAPTPSLGLYIFYQLDGFCGIIVMVVGRRRRGLVRWARVASARMTRRSRRRRPCCARGLVAARMA